VLGLVFALTLVGCGGSGAASSSTTRPERARSAPATTTTTTTTTTTLPAGTTTSLPPDVTDAPAPETAPPEQAHSPLVAPPEAPLPSCTPFEQKMQDMPGYGYVLTICDPQGYYWYVPQKVN
jgi:hypothetical protein